MRAAAVSNDCVVSNDAVMQRVDDVKWLIYERLYRRVIRQCLGPYTDSITAHTAAAVSHDHCSRAVNCVNITFDLMTPRDVFDSSSSETESIRTKRERRADGGIPAHFSVPSVLSVVWHIRAPCFNHSTDLDAIWQVYTVVESIVLDRGHWPPGKGEIWGPKQAIVGPMLPPGEYKWGAIPPLVKLLWSFFCQITEIVMNTVWWNFWRDRA